MYKVVILVVSFALLILAGCADEVQTPQPAASTTKSSVAAKKSAAEKQPEEMPDENQEQVYSYNPIGKRDPFTSPMASFVDVEGLEEEPLTPLQRYDIEQYRLSGVVLGLGAPKAMVASPDGKSYILQLGTKIGKNGGKVVKINNEGVLVEEVLRDFSGETRVNSVLIALPKRKGV